MQAVRRGPGKLGTRRSIRTTSRRARNKEARQETRQGRDREIDRLQARELWMRTRPFIREEAAVGGLLDKAIHKS